MKKNFLSRGFAFLLHQIWNEKRSNTALFLELLIVSSIVWFLVDCLYVILACRAEPTGFDATNCYKLTLSTLDQGSVGYDAAHPTDSAAVAITDHLALIDLVRHDEDVELAAYSHRNDPYNASSQTMGCKVDTFTTTGRYLLVQPDFIRLFRYTDPEGKHTTEQLAQALERYEVLVSPGACGDSVDLSRYVGQKAFVSNDSLHLRIASLATPVKRFTWEETRDSEVIVIWLSEGYLTDHEYFNLSIRVKAQRMPGFEQRMRERIKSKQWRAGNFYVSDFIAYDQLRTNTESVHDAQIRNYTVSIVFLLVNVFLGLLGTFWFRTQQRYPEIGIQKAMGATNADVALRLTSEAMTIMTAAFLLSMVVSFNIAHAGLTSTYQGLTLTAPRFVLCELMAYALMTLIIGLGIWFPTLRATKANPADVLRGE